MAVATTLSASTAGGSREVEGLLPSFWPSLRYFNVYRLVLAGLCLLGGSLQPELVGLGGEAPRLFVFTSAAYLVLAVVYQVVLLRWPRHFTLQVGVHVVTDIVVLTVLAFASGGFRSGVELLLLISLAGAALVSGALHTLFYAALASIAVLIEQAAQTLVNDAGAAGFLQPGLLAIGFFATAFITNRLAQRVIQNEKVVRQRSVELANQVRINELVIQDVADGVLVVDGGGMVRLRNRQAELLTGRPGGAAERIESLSPELALRLGTWREFGRPAVATVAMPASGATARARFVEAGVEGANVSLVFLEDLSKLEAQARQLKLAALGRLTANIAHEIRNPLSAITHAAELMQEENRAEPRQRLSRIIRDNAHRLNRIVSDVLELNRRDRADPEPIRLAGFLATFVEEFVQSQGVSRDSVEVDCPADATAQFDRVHLYQVLSNLVRNAWRHSRRSVASVRIRVRSHGDRLELDVIDDGEGVPEPLRGQLFEPFFTTFSSGTGLGLFIARELCAANGALLDYVDNGGGADFRIRWQGTRNDSA